ncbi:hypothetical protein ACFCY8_33920 [Streptomyces noursei]|uniref:hypothetical protein n=1 Tax=Streptomyces noursei TaxID=1971 RepID=UPI0035DE6394
MIELRTAAYAETLSPEAAAKKARKATELPSYGTPKTRQAAAGAVTDYLLEVAPGEYATAEAAEAMGAKERVDEVLPGLAVARGKRDGSVWGLVHLPSHTEERERRHLGPLFKSRQRARDVARADLAHLDWTRSTQELLDDPVTGATVKIVKCRELLKTGPKSNAWAREPLRQAEADLAAATAGVTA